jgi:hypothetical protein
MITLGAACALTISGAFCCIACSNVDYKISNTQQGIDLQYTQRSKTNPHNARNSGQMIVHSGGPRETCVGRLTARYTVTFHQTLIRPFLGRKRSGHPLHLCAH